MIPFYLSKGITFKEVSGGTSLTFQSLDMQTQPSTLEYNVGDLLSFDGMVLYAIYSDGTDTFMKDVTDIATPNVAEGTEITESTPTTITFTYTDGTTDTVSYQITVSVPLTSKPIYEDGVYNFESITGKYTDVQSGSGTKSLDGTFVKVTADGSSAVHTLLFNYKFDVTDLSYIKVTAKAQSYAGVNISDTNENYQRGTKTRWATSNGSAVSSTTWGTKYNSLTNVNYVIDVRDLTGEYYVRAGCNYNYSQGIMQISKMWLE